MLLNPSYLPRRKGAGSSKRGGGRIPPPLSIQERERVRAAPLRVMTRMREACVVLPGNGADSQSGISCVVLSPPA